MSKAYRLGEIAERFGGELAGDPDIVVAQIASLERAGPANITFLSNPQYAPLLKSTRAGAVILPAQGYVEISIPRIRCDDPYLYFAKVSRLFNEIPEVKPGIHPSVIVHRKAIVSPLAQISAGCVVAAYARIDEGAVIGPGCVLEERSHIGEHTRLVARVSVYPGSKIGKRCLIHAGVVIGSDGFGFALERGQWLKIPQIGSCQIGDDVEIGANSTIDRGALDDTVIEDGVKLDNQIQIGHNVHIGAHTAIAGCVGIAGSAKIGVHCTIGGGAVILGHLSIGDHVHISAGTLVAKSIKKSGTYTGIFPTDEHRNWLKNAVQLRHLDSLADRISELEKRRDTSE